MQDTVTRITWKEAQKLGGNPYGQSPQPEMLLDEGLIIRRRYNKLGRKTFGMPEPKWFDVAYDKDYVVAWLENQLLLKLNGIPYNQLQKLLSAAMALHKERSKGEWDE